jgi:hypothetical protein
LSLAMPVDNQERGDYETDYIDGSVRDGFAGGFFGDGGGS